MVVSGYCLNRGLSRIYRIVADFGMFCVLSAFRNIVMHFADVVCD